MTEIKSAALELGTERIRKLLVQYAVPAIIAMTASSLYNMVDSIFIGHGVGPLAILGSRICMCRHIGSRGSRSRKYSLRGPVLQGIKQ